MGPGYYGKSFYIWPPDPRYTAGADPTNISSSNPVQDTSNRSIADWRKRFFLAPSGSSSTKGTPIADNSKLFSSTGVWNGQNLGGTVNYIPNYDAILAWIKNGPQTLPPASASCAARSTAATPRSSSWSSAGWPSPARSGSCAPRLAAPASRSPVSSRSSRSSRARSARTARRSA